MEGVRRLFVVAASLSVVCLAVEVEVGSYGAAWAGRVGPAGGAVLGSKGGGKGGAVGGTFGPQHKYLGVHPDQLERYAAVSGGRFLVCDGGRQVPPTQVNDNYCDCEDGADEPATAACSAGTALFWCGGGENVSIPTSFVGDGVCDCCGGWCSPYYTARKVFQLRHQRPRRYHASTSAAAGAAAAAGTLVPL